MGSGFWGLTRCLDAAVAAANGWEDYRPEMPDEVILSWLLALNLKRWGKASPNEFQLRLRALPMVSDEVDDQGDERDVGAGMFDCGGGSGCGGHYVAKC